MPTILNSGKELGEVVEMRGETEVVVGENPNDSYLPENEQEWTWESVPCEEEADGTLVVYGWDSVGDEAREAIRDLHGNIVGKNVDCMEISGRKCSTGNYDT